jgi:PKD repeat protein
MVHRRDFHRDCWLGVLALALLPLLPAAWSPAGPDPTLRATRPTPPAARALWAKTYGGPQDDEEGTLVRENGDGTYVLSGWTRSTPDGLQKILLMQVDAAGNVLWQKTYGTSGESSGQVLPTPDGGFAILIDGNNSAPWGLVKLDPTGDISWQRDFGTTEKTFKHIESIPGGGFLLHQCTWGLHPTKVGTARMMRLDSGGNILWQKEYSSPTMLFERTFVTPLADGSLMADLVWVNESYEKKRVLAKLDAGGAIVWQKLFSVPSGMYDGAFRPAPDGGYLFGGSFDAAPWPGSYKNDLLIAKGDSSGALSWQKTYAGERYDSLEYIFPADGGYFFSGWTSSGTSDASLAGKVDHEGNLLWAKTYGGPEDYLFAGGGEIAGGHLLQGTMRTPSGEGQDPVWAVMVAEEGAILWQRAYGGSEGAHGALRGAGNGGLLLTGQTRTVGAGQNDLWFWSLDSQGQLGYPCPLMMDTAIAPVPIVFEVNPGTLTAVDSDMVAQDSAYASGSPSTVQVSIALSPQDACESTQALVAIAAVTPDSGLVPLTAHFTGDATGGRPPYSYSWTFADGGTSTEQNPSHTYATPGHYNAVLVVTDSAHVTDLIGVNVQVTTSCTLSCTTTVPATGAMGMPVSFTSAVETADCWGGPTFEWHFGDGFASISTDQNPTHTYATHAIFTWRLVVKADDATCTRQGTIYVGSGVPGDCDMTSTASIGEVQRAINMFLEINPPDCGVDCNGDGVITIGEVQKVINAFLGLPSSC